MSASASPVDPWLLERLACPSDHGPLQPEEGALVCPGGHRFPVVDGVPVLLLDSMPATMAGLDRSRGAAARSIPSWPTSLPPRTG